MKKIVSAAAVIVAASMCLVGCSAGSDAGNAPADPATVKTAPKPTAPPKAVEHIGDVWSFSYKGATGSFKLTGNDTDSTVQAVESARQTVNGAPVTLVPVTIDNTSGTSPINMYGITVVTMDGQQVQSSDLSDSFSAWRDAAGDDTDKYNALVDAENKYGNFDLQPGAKGTALVAFAGPITSAKMVYVMPAGGSDQVTATAR